MKEKIERLRSNLNDLSRMKVPTPEMIKASQKLDKLIIKEMKSQLN